MNLLPITEKDELKKGLKARSLIISSLLAAAAFLAALVFLLPAYLLALSNLSKIGEESYLLNIKNEDSSKTLAALPDEIGSRLKFLESNLGEASASETLSRALASLPAGVALNSVSFSRNQDESRSIKVSLEGTAADRSSLLSLSDILKGSGHFSAVDIPVSNLTKDRDLPFTIGLLIENQK